MNSGALRALRRPVPGFDRLPLATVSLQPARWWNLRWREHARRETLYFSSLSARLTPAGGQVPCLYLSPSEKTSFLELYGDKIAGDRVTGAVPRMLASDFRNRVFLQVETPALLLADLSTGKAVAAIHLDLGTLYAADPEYPRAFAQAIFDHPARVDGIIYESRHTKESCVVIWHVRQAALEKIAFEVKGTLAVRTTLAGAAATVFDQTVEVVS